MPIPPITEFAGLLPDEEQPASFSARAAALFNWQVDDLAPELNAFAAAVNAALNDDGTVLDSAARAIRLAINSTAVRPSTGAVGDFTVVPSVAIPTPIAAGEPLVFRANHTANSLPVRLNGTEIRKVDSTGALRPLDEGDVLLGEIHGVQHTGTYWELITHPLQDFAPINSATLAPRDPDRPPSQKSVADFVIAALGASQYAFKSDSNSPDWSTSWTALQFNTTDYNTAGFTAASNQFTVPSTGTYEVDAVFSVKNDDPGNSRQAQARLYNVTSGGKELVGMSGVTGPDTMFSALNLRGRFQAAAGDKLEVQGKANGASVRGAATALGEEDVFWMVTFRKVVE